LVGHSSYIHFKPVGVVVIISPWNFPWGIPYSQIIVALAVGNSVILKPSSETPLTAIKMKEVMENAGLNKDLLIIAPGSGSTIGKALAEASIGRVVFTGSTEVGLHIIQSSSKHITPITHLA